MSQQPSYRCPWCLRDTYNPNDVQHSFCPCCGDAVLSKKDCEHRQGATLSDLWVAGVTLVRREPWADGNYLELVRAGAFSPHFSAVGLIHSPLEWAGVPGDVALPAQQVPLWGLPLAGWEAYTGVTVEQGDSRTLPQITDLGDGAFLVRTPGTRNAPDPPGEAPDDDRS